MTEQQIAAMQLALEALKSCSGVPHWPSFRPVIADLTAALEQPAQEVDWEKLYRLEVKKKEALAAKYERDTGKQLTRIVPMNQPAQQEPVDKNGSPCPEFWDWLPKAYNFDGLSVFTKYNMEVAFLAGKQSVATSDTSLKQEPVAWINWCAATGKRSVSFECESELASEPLYAGITQNTQGHYSKFHSWFDSELHRQKYTKDHPAYLAAQEAWNAANDDAQHRINRLSAEIEAWKARFKIAEDALVKLNGMEGAPVAWMYDIARYGPTDLRGQQWRPAISRTKPNIHDSLVRDLTPLYTRPQAREWVGLTDEEIRRVDHHKVDGAYDYSFKQGAKWAEAKLREKNA